MSAETTIAAPADPNAINFMELQIPGRDLSTVMTGLYRIDRAYPILPPGARDWVRPALNYGDGYVERNPKRDRLEWSLLHLAPAAGELIMSLDDPGRQPDLSAPQVAQLKTGVAPLVTSASTREMLGSASDRDWASAFRFIASSGLPFVAGLDVFDSRVRAKIAPQLETARPYLDALTTGEQAGPRQQFQREVTTLLDRIRDSARSNAATRERQAAADGSQGKRDRLERRLQETPDRYLTREDVGVGIADAIQMVLTDAGSTPMLHGLVQVTMSRNGDQRRTPNLNSKVLEIGSDLIVESLLFALPESQWEEFNGLFRAATSPSKLSVLARTALGMSTMVPSFVKRKLAQHYGLKPELVERAHRIYQTLGSELPKTFGALSRILPASSEDVRNIQHRLERVLGARQHAGRTALAAAS